MSDDILKTYLYYRFTNGNVLYPSSKYSKYYCNVSTSHHYCTSEQEEYYCLLGGDDFYIDNIYFVNAKSNITFCDGQYKTSSSYSAKTHTPNKDINARTNLLYVNSKSSNLIGKDVLLDTDYYQKQRDEELKILIESNSSSSGSASTTVDMTNTNNILFTIALIMCVMLLLSILRKLFNRSVN